MILGDLGAAIETHSHDEDLTTDKFWESMLAKYWDEYHKEPGHHTYKGFMIWCEEKDLIPSEVDYE